MVLKALLEKMTLKKQPPEGMSHVLGKGVSGRGHNMSKGPEVGLCLVYCGNSEETSVAGAQ